MIRVHHLAQSRSHRILWLLEELGLDYEIEHYQRHPRTLLAPAALKALHPLGKSPLITLEDGTVLAESGAILEVLSYMHPEANLAVKPGEAGWREYLYWMHYAEGSLMPLLVMSLVFRRIKQSPMPFFARPIASWISKKVIQTYIQPQLDDHLVLLERWFSQNPWCAANRFSAADIQLGFPLEAMVSRSSNMERAPSLLAYLERLRQRPAYRKSEERGGSVSL